MAASGETVPDEGHGDDGAANEERRLTFRTGDEIVSGLLLAPAEPRVLYVYGHGAGAGMEHPFMNNSARALFERRIATFRYNFPYMEHRSGRPDRTAVLVSTVRAAVDAAASALPGVPLLAGGKSMGGRMSSHAQAEAPLPGVLGLVFVGFPLHRPKKPSTERATHLARVKLPMLFLQGTRDEMADADLVRIVTDELGPGAILHSVEGADHGFHVLKRSGRTDAEVMIELADRIDGWVREVIGR